MPKLLDVAHVSLIDLSLRITVPEPVQEKLGIDEGETIGFYEEGESAILKKMD